MGDKLRKLTVKERMDWFQRNLQAVWKDEVNLFVQDGYTHDEAIVVTLDFHNVPKMGRTVVRGSQVVKVV
jgi:hypothetical protein